MKFNVFELYNHKSGKKVKCAIITTDNSFILITVLDEITKVREYKNKRDLINDLMILKRRTKSSLVK